jgi:hypothetical protein
MFLVPVCCISRTTGSTFRANAAARSRVAAAPLACASTSSVRLPSTVPDASRRHAWIAEVEKQMVLYPDRVEAARFCL